MGILCSPLRKVIHLCFKKGNDRKIRQPGKSSLKQVVVGGGGGKRRQIKDDSDPRGRDSFRTVRAFFSAEPLRIRKKKGPTSTCERTLIAERSVNQAVLRPKGTFPGLVLLIRKGTTRV